MQHALTVMVFDAALKYPANHGKSGNLIAAHASDTAKLLELAMFIHGLWVSPILVVGALIAIWFFIGWAGLIGVALMVLTTPLQGIIMGKVYGLRGEQVKKMDNRVTFINEALQGIRICKFMNWEGSFNSRVQDARLEEVDVLRRMYTYRILFAVIMNTLPQIITFALFTIAFGIDDGSITPDNVFPALAMINVIRIPLMFIPMSIGKLFETKISLGRIQNVLLNTDRRDFVTHAAIEAQQESDIAVELKSVTVLGDAEKAKKKQPAEGPPGQKPAPDTGKQDGAEDEMQARPRLIEDISLAIPKNKLTIIIGPTAAGKSTLVSAIVGEADVTEGSSVDHYGSMAFVPQDAWIQNATVRENITFGQDFDEEWYIDTIIGSQLMADLKQLSASDATAIGERGINLSGGQKQRVALARAVYSKREIVVMDDPLSAVDPHVCRALFEGCICGDVMAGRTRILVTHQVQFLPQADLIVVMDKCRVAFTGTYAEYLASDVKGVLEEECDKADAEAEADGAKEAAGAIAIATVDTGAVDEKAQEEAEKLAAARKLPLPSKDSLESSEEAAIGDVQWDTYSWYTRLGSYSMFILTILFSLMWTAANVTFNLMLAWWSSDAEVGGRKLTNNEYIMWFGIMCAICLLMVFCRQFAYSRFALNVARNLHGSLMENMMKAPMSFFDTTPIGRIMNRFTRDIEIIDMKIAESSLMVINLIFNVLSTIVMVCIAAPYLTAIFPVLLFAFFHLYKYYTQTVRGIKRLEGIGRSPMMSLMGEVIGGLSSIRAYGMADALRAEHLRRVRVAMRPPYVTRLAQRWLATRTEFLGSFVIISTSIFAVATVTNDTSSWNVSTEPSVVALALTFALSTTNAITFLTRMLGEIESDMSSTERVKEYAGSIPKESDVVYGTGPDAVTAPASGWPSPATVEFRDVSLRYREDKPLVLKDVSFKVEAAQRVGVVGRTGSGKSTVMLALFRMVEACSGGIFLGGVSTRDVTLSDLREAITIIPQDPVLFRGTVRSNLDPFSRFDDDRLWDVIDKVGLGDRVRFGAAGDESRAEKDSAAGLDTIVQDKGSNFSVGQRQLICLGRALLKKTSILLMDEATASVDFETDAFIQRTVREEFTGATVLTIAHRLATVIDSDRILVLDGGVVKEYASPSDLLEDGSSQFYDMVKQLGDEQFEELKSIADGRLSFTDNLKSLVEKEKEKEKENASFTSASKSAAVDANPTE
jgi:ATP-binding cassette subfamily C (CFTR/MRP) protein 1